MVMQVITCKNEIGNIEIKNNIVLAPMAGVSNYAFMKICEEMGVGYVVTELLSAEAIVRNNKKTLEMLKGIDKLNIPVGIQLFGSNASSLARAAKIIEELYPNAKTAINYQLSNSMLCEVIDAEVNDEMITKINDKFKEIVEKDIPIIKTINII